MTRDNIPLPVRAYLTGKETKDAHTEGEKTIVLARLTGDFPGSPIDLNHIFTISDNEIISLEIRS